MADPSPPAPNAVRLIFEYEGDQVRLVAQQPVQVAIPGFDISSHESSGHFVEVRAETEETLSRIPIREAFSSSTEVFPEEPGDPITRVDLPQPRGAFTVLVPVAEAAHHVAVVRIGSRPDAQRILASPTSAAPGEPDVLELGTFPLERGGETGRVPQ
jgi:hypothetical protein